MQVLNAPSREEVNEAHSKDSWLGIGVPSVRNVARVSKFKAWAWLVLLLSSVPIHLLFNSTIFQADHRESDFRLTIATEDFLDGAAFYPPGASLFPPGFGFSDDEHDPLNDALANFVSSESDVYENSSIIAINARQWQRMNNEECKQEYLDCAGIKNHRNLVLVADKSGGWVRDGMCEVVSSCPNPALPTTLTLTLWNQYVPHDQPNHLFFDTPCQMQAIRGVDEPTHCLNSCISVMIRDCITQKECNGPFIKGPDWQYSFLSKYELQLINSSHGSSVSVYYSAFLPGALDLSIKYCLAEPLDRTCHVGVSPVILMGVTICVIIKTCTAILVTMVLVRRKQTPLVTLGDALASFIETPDPITAGLCTFGQDDVQELLIGKPASLRISACPQPWKPMQKRRERRRWAAAPNSLWLTSYLLFALGIVICGTAFVFAYRSTGLWGRFLESDQNLFLNTPFTFFEAIVTANSPQLLLSACYLAYNNLFTHLQMGREWELFSEQLRPLRVTDPQGDQIATYRLQLPYKYSVPLIAVSIFLHWLLSNVIYVFVSTGGTYYGPGFIEGQRDSTLPLGAMVAASFSTYALLTMLIVSCVLITIPILLSLKRLSPNTINIGSNSFALSAACHVSRLSQAATSSDELAASYTTQPSPSNAGGIEMQELEVASQSSAAERLIGDRVQGDDSAGNDDERSLFKKLARSKLRWGVIQMPPEWYAEYDEHEAMVEHLGFGVEEDNVQSPVLERTYA
ncbi:hypothetical protein GGR52DRAFT_578517 [Hypoxylon sp. FL1284]|nr:hypothetical protein GGR52DRAFT_578517 [Hypoxylon sp. FL1284]